MQAQDYHGAKWALGLRGVSEDAVVEAAFNSGSILRTHVMRPTWHFVTPADIRWMLKLTAPRVYATCGSYFRKLELDDRTRARSRAAIGRALGGGKHLTRAELATTLQSAGINPATTIRLAFLVMSAELDGVICSGARRGNQFTYALLEQRAPKARSLDRDEALAELTIRYFSSHGPATARDFGWWSGLTAREVKTALEITRRELLQESIDGRAYWFKGPAAAVRPAVPAAYLLPNYDEYMIAYKDRPPPSTFPRRTRIPSRQRDFAHHYVIDGQLAGTWMRTRKADHVVIAVNPYWRMAAAHRNAIRTAAERCGRFLATAVRVVLAQA